MTLQARLDEMLATAREATSGPWRLRPGPSGTPNGAHIVGPGPKAWWAEGPVIVARLPHKADKVLEQKQADGAHIAQSNPAVFAALVDAVKAAELVREMVPHGPDRYELETALTALESALEAGNE